MMKKDTAKMSVQDLREALGRLIDEARVANLRGYQIEEVLDSALMALRMHAATTKPW
jgi:hypothetical protein